MKRFWLEDKWHWSTLARMTPPRVPGVSPCYLLAIIVFIHFVPSSPTVGKICDITALTPCFTDDEICRQVNGTSAVCECLAPFQVNKATGKCEYPDPPPESTTHYGLALGLGITSFLVLVVLVLTLLHRKFGLFSGMCDRLPSLRNLTIRSGDIIMVDNGDDDDDVNPIV